MAVREILAGLLVFNLAVSAACASSGGSPAESSSAPTAVAVNSDQPPRMKQSVSIMRMPGRFNGTIELPVDEAGRPDIPRMRVMGTMTEDVRREISDWLAQASYEPAMRNGVPVPGVMSIKFRMR